MASSDCSYDRLVMGLTGASSATPGTGAAAPSNMTQMFNASSAEPFDYEAAWGLNRTFVLTVSDHLPLQVWMNVLGASGMAAGMAASALNAAGSVGPNAWIVSAGTFHPPPTPPHLTVRAADLLSCVFQFWLLWCCSPSRSTKTTVSAPPEIDNSLS
jgi:hypothetical protein